MTPEQKARRVAEATAWCLPRANAADATWSLRSHELMPEDQVAEPRGHNPRPYSKEDWKVWLAEVVGRRERLLRDRGEYPAAVPSAQAGSRLVLFWPDEQLADGAAMDASGGFFDMDNTAAWDTWLWLQEKGDEWWIASWVPPALAEVVALGAFVNPEGCLQCVVEGAESEHPPASFQPGWTPAAAVWEVTNHPWFTQGDWLQLVDRYRRRP